MSEKYPLYTDAPNAPTGVLITERVFNSSEFASVTLGWNDPVGRVDGYAIQISIGSSLSQQYYYNVAIPTLKLARIPYNENATISISAVNCIDKSEEVNVSFIISKHFHQRPMHCTI